MDDANNSLSSADHRVVMSNGSINQMSATTAPTAGDATVRHELEAVGALAEPTRRLIYEHVVAQRRWVGRDEVAAALDLRRGITVHHLDRLAADGLLEVDHQRINGRTGPGAGRPAKVYRRATTEVDVSLPPRRYDLVGKLLSEAVDRVRTVGTPIEIAIEAASREAGRQIGASGNHHVAAEAGTAARREALLSELSARGFEPETDAAGVTRLRNCPFHRLSQEHTELICGMNLNLLEGVVEGFGGVGLDPRLEPHPGECCVCFHPAVDTERPTAVGPSDAGDRRSDDTDDQPV